MRSKLIFGSNATGFPHNMSSRGGSKKQEAAPAEIKWLQCDLCQKWRRMPVEVDISQFEGQECVR